MAETKTPALVLAGTILVDIIKTIEAYPEAGRLVKILKMDRSVGGAVPNTGIDLVRIDPDFPVRAFGRVGDDEYGRYAVNTMTEAGLDTSCVLVSDTAPTSFTDVMNVAGGERTFFTMPGAGAELDVGDFDLDALAPSHLHLAYLLLMETLDAPDADYGCRSARLLAEAKRRGIRTSVDLVSESSDRYKSAVLPTLPYVDVLIINELEAAAITGIAIPKHPKREELMALTEALLSLGVREKVILHCPDLGVCHDKVTGFTAVPSLSLPEGYIAGATGAGDAFCAGALYALTHGYDDERLLRLGSLSAAASLSAADAVGGMLPLDKLWELETRFGRKELH
ncbi:MAG: carbohydrate kinase family protein [Clostridia bacterium]|nr:carbohydrate kinase family protein [Clostridia bacterium]